MSNVIELPHRDRVYDDASLWIAKLDKQLSPEETSAFQRWLAADPEHQAVLYEMAKLWDKMDSLHRLSSLFPEPAAHQANVSRYAVASAAAVVLLVVGLLFSGYFPGFTAAPSNSHDAEIAYQTDTGEHSTVTLQDGTQIVLNTNTLVRVSYSDRARLLMLDRGEVFVKVAKDKTRPLSVIAGEQVVQAVGTAFNVEINRNQQIELVVVEGKVKVGVRPAQKSTKPQRNLASLPGTSKTLVAGQALMLGQTDQQVTPITLDDIEVKLSWRRGNLIFRGESLEEAVREVERYTSLEFVFMDEDLKAIRVAGLFRAGDVQGLLATLRENFDIAYQYTDEQKVQLSAR